ncbi:STAS domain-containing protein [Streptomyces sp. CA-142005]|uniref:STAS domain-containing protein n=1 Tax=Streptomyces sp. CA-142005 TaxID=3240052 RepID=UPI003D937E5D
MVPQLRNPYIVLRRILHRIRLRVTQNARQPHHAVVRLSGEVTAKKAARFEREVRQALASKPQILEIDLRRVSYLGLDSGRVFLMPLRWTQPAGTRLIVTHVSDQARRALNRMGLEPLLEIHDEDPPT